MGGGSTSREEEGREGGGGDVELELNVREQLTSRRIGSYQAGPLGRQSRPLG